MYTYRRWRTHTACGMRTPPTHRVRYAYATYGTCALIHAHTRFRRSQTISTVCVRHFSSVWVCRPTAWIKTRGWRRSDADCRFLLFCSNRGQRVNPRLSVTVAERAYRVPIIVGARTPGVLWRLFCALYCV